MKKNFENKNILVIVFEIAVIALGIVGITYATNKIISDRTTTIIKTGEFAVDYKGDKTISFDNLSPMSDDLVNINTKENVIRLTFSVRGAKQNKDESLIYDVMLNDMNIDCGLLNKYTKWNLYKNGELLTNGSLDPSFDGAVLSDTMHLTTTQQDLPKYNEEYDKYVLLFWISESCDDLTNCEMVDQSAILDSTLSMNVFIALYGGEKVEYTRLPSLDTSCANKPLLTDNMIPITYKDGIWVVADKDNSNEEYKWYDYNNAVWANSVVVKNNNYETIGTPINDEDVLGYYVWIPRYRYKLWNVEDKITDSYNAYDNGINIIFENGLNTKNNELKNNNYITHPVFADSLKGVWISKYEISKNNDNYYFLPNVEAYTGRELDEYKQAVNNVTKMYGSQYNLHMINNLEWGSALYLSHSKYGVCKSDGCDSITLNDTYIAGANKQDTLTRNVYGIYDMAGASREFVLDNQKIGTATSEVTLSNSDTWYHGLGLANYQDYILRGGINKGLFSFSDLSMSEAKYSTRVAFTTK